MNFYKRCDKKYGIKKHSNSGAVIKPFAARLHGVNPFPLTVFGYRAQVVSERVGFYQITDVYVCVFIHVKKFKVPVQEIFNA